MSSNKNNTKTQVNNNTTLNKTFVKRRMTYPHLLKSKFVKKWITEYSENQRQGRLKVLDQFCKFIDKSPDEIILEHAEDQSQKNPLNKTNIAKSQLHAFYKYLIISILFVTT